MKKIESILVGVDYSQNSENALREASRIANWNNARLHCLHVLEEEPLGEFRKNKMFDEPGVLAAAEYHLENVVARTVGAGHDIRCHVKIGHPFKEIVAAIEAEDIDLVVLGSHGFNTTTASRTGVFASRCVRKAPTDVLLVRERQIEPFRNVVACVDFSDNSIRAAHRAAEIAEQDKAALELFHVYRSPIYAASDAGGVGPLLPPSDTAEIIASLRDKLERLAEKVSDRCGGYEIHAAVREQVGVSDGIVQRLKELGADLVVLGTRGRTGIKKLLMGTTAEHLIHDSPCSALAVKPEGYRYVL